MMKRILRSLVTTSAALFLCASLTDGSKSGGEHPIKHIIVLMMENRSFDHLLGWLHSDYSPSIDGLQEGDSTPRDPNDAFLGSVEITRNGYDIGPDDPLHDFTSVSVQINSQSMNGFVYDARLAWHNESNPVSMFDSTSAPILNTLAQEFAVFNRWFCSIPGPTDPNRAYAMSGTSVGRVTNFDGSLWTQQSYFDYLRVHNRSFSAYYQDDVWAVGYFADMNTPVNSRYIHSLDDDFFNDLSAGNLAQFVWLQPRMTTHSSTALPTWQHPDASVLEGERLIKKVYESLRASPLWESSVLLITYDEHGGFYDHVPPPNEGVPNPDNVNAANGFKFDQLGVRIPTVAVSPFIKKNTIVTQALPGEKPTSSSEFDSTSIMATANKILGLEGIPLLGKRAEWANTFVGLFTELDSPRSDCPVTLPELPPPSQDAYDLQRTKPLNDHLEHQLLFYCVNNYPELHGMGQCPGTPALLNNQGKASDWLLNESKRYLEKLRAAERDYDMMMQNGVNDATATL